MAFGASESLALSAVLDDAVTALKTIANLVDYKGMPSDKNHYTLETQRILFSHMNKVLTKYSQTKNSTSSGKRFQVNNNAAFEEMELLIEDSFTSPQYQKKLIHHLSTVVELFQKLSEELRTKGSFTILNEAIKKEEEQFREIEELYNREKESRERINALRADIEKSKKDGIGAVERNKEMIAHLKDQVQEIKAKAIMEGKYMARCSAVQLEEVRGQCEQREKQLAEEIKKLTLKKDQESRVSAETRSFLHNRVGELQQLSEYWQEKSQKNIEEMRHKLNVLKTSKSKDLARLRELTNQYQECEAVVLADRIAAEQARQQKEQEELEQQAVAKIQNWWRCISVRRNLGLKKKKAKKKKGNAKGKPGTTR